VFESPRGHHIFFESRSLRKLPSAYSWTVADSVAGSGSKRTAANLKATTGISRAHPAHPATNAMVSRRIKKAIRWLIGDHSIDARHQPTSVSGYI
jgi:hypothetical protein